MRDTRVWTMRIASFESRLKILRRGKRVATLALAVPRS